MSPQPIDLPRSARATRPRDVLSPRSDLPHSDYLNPHHLVAAWGSATARYWRRRAATFEDAKPRDGDYLGRATHEDLARQWDRLDSLAKACRHNAEVFERYGASDGDRNLIIDVATALAAAA